jgi:hypothetical protein
MQEYASFRQRNGIPSGPGALLDADVKIAVLTSELVTGSHGSVSGGGRLPVCSGKVGGGGNIVLWNSVALSSNVVKLSPSWVRTGVRCDRRGLVYFSA